MHSHRSTSRDRERSVQPGCRSLTANALATASCTSERQEATAASNLTTAPHALFHPDQFDASVPCERQPRVYWRGWCQQAVLQCGYGPKELKDPCTQEARLCSRAGGQHHHEGWFLP